MSKIGLVIQREYLSRVKKRSFILMTLLGPIIFAGLMAVAIFVTQADTQEHKVLVVDQPGLISKYLDDASAFVPTCMDCFPEREDFEYRFTNETLSDSAFINSDYTVMIEMYEGLYQHKKVNLYYKKIPAVTATSRIERDLERAIERAKVQNEAVMDYETYKRMKVDIGLNQISIEKGDTFEAARAGLGMFFAVIIFFFIFLFGAYVMRGVIEEKTNRIIEVIVSSVRPFELMMGKIIGVGFVAITQVAIWIVFSLVIFLIAGAFFEAGMIGDVAALQENMQATGAANADFETYLAQQEGFSMLVETNWGLIIGMFIIYFIGGYLMYASLFAAIGAAVDNETDTQQFMTPVMLPLFFSYIVAIMSVNNPEGFAAHLFSFIPLTAPTTMMVRVAVGSVAVWELALSVGILIATCYFMIWLAAKIYRTGILMYGKRPSYKELWKWIVYRS